MHRVGAGPLVAERYAMRTLVVAVLGSLAFGCASQADDPCAAAAAAWTSCTGAVPAGFADACAQDPSIATTATSLTCADLLQLDSGSKADGNSSPFDSWDKAVQPANFDTVSDGVYRGEHLLLNSKARFISQAPR